MRYIGKYITDLLADGVARTWPEIVLEIDADYDELKRERDKLIREGEIREIFSFWRWLMFKDPIKYEATMISVLHPRTPIDWDKL